MKQLFLDSNEAFEVYLIALTAVAYYKNEVEKDYKYNLEESIKTSDEKKLEVAKKLLEFTRLTSKAFLITEIENPF